MFNINGLRKVYAYGVQVPQEIAKLISAGERNE
jgi:hypothetical protein